ncbi:MAG: cation transporter [Actinomycetota bacterium]|nr:cation transporter [Actinomycetota bacterium]
MISTWVVSDVTCGHCKAAIEGEVAKLPGVERVDVDVDTKRVTVEGDVARDDVVAAIVEAGYEEILAE